MWFDLRDKKELKQLRDKLASEPSCTKEQVEQIYKNIVAKAKKLYGVDVDSEPVWDTLSNKVRAFAYYHLLEQRIHLIGDWLLCNGKTFAEEICAHEIAHAVQHIRWGQTDHCRHFNSIWENLLGREHNSDIFNFERVPTYYRYIIECPRCNIITPYRSKPRRKEVTCRLCKNKFNVQENLIENKVT